MLRFVVFALFTASAVVSIRRIPLIDYSGIVHCGSQGKVLDVRVTDCTSLPCPIKVESTHTIEVNFIPSTAHERLTFLLSFIRGVQETEIVHEDLAYAVSPVNEYTITYPWNVSGQLGTGLAALRIQVKGNNGGVVELCSNAYVNLVA